MSYARLSPPSVVTNDRQSSSGRYGLIGRKGLRGGRMTKVNGRAASYADEAGGASYASASPSLLSGVAASLIGSVSSAALAATFRRLVAVPAMGTIAAAAIAVPALVGTTGDAAAACVETGAGTSIFNCTTSEVTEQDLDGAIGNVLEVNVDAAVTFVTPAGDAFNLYSYAGIDFTQAAGGGVITGLYRGISSYNVGTGSTSITATGDVTGVAGIGIIARNNGIIGTDVTVTAAAVSGYLTGISVTTSGTGAASVTATGAVTATTRDGINVRVGSRGTDASVNAASVSGDDYGIRVSNLGYGSTSITATGAVAGVTRAGIAVDNDNTTVNLTVNAASVSGGEDGINVRNRGTGVTSVTTSGHVSSGAGSNDNGIAVEHLGTDLIMNVATVDGEDDGIYAVSLGTGTVTITASGHVSGQNRNGISVASYNPAGGDVIVNAASTSSYTYSAISVLNFGASAITITASDYAYGSFQDGISAFNVGANGTDITVNAVTATGGSRGIFARNSGVGAVTITATDAMIGRNRDGIYGRNLNANSTDVIVTATTVTGGTNGIFGRNAGMGVTSITATDAVMGTNGSGIYAHHSGTNLTVTATTVTGGTNGIDARHYGTGSTSITTSGNVTGTSGDGIRTTHQSAGALAFAITTDVYGGTYGVHNTASSRGGAFTIAGTGTVSGGSGIAFNDAADGTFGDASSVLDVYGELLGDARMGTGGDQMIIRSSAVLGPDGAALGVGNGVQFDGDDGAASFTTGDIDMLVFEGRSDTLDGARILNFEQVLLTNASDVTFVDVLAPGTGLANENPVDGLLLQVNNGSFARFAASFMVGGNVNNFGTLDLSSVNGTADTVLTVTGNFGGNSSSLILDTTLDGDDSPTDLLVVDGNTAGITNVTFNVVGGAGAQTDTGIRVVDVGGMSDGTFVMANPDMIVDGVGVLIAGAYSYELTRGDDVGDDSSNDWFLKMFEPDESPAFAPSTPIYEQLPAALASLNGLPTLQQRVGNRYWNAADIGSTSSGGSSNGAVIEQNAIWTRVEGAHASVDPDTSTTDAKYDTTTWQLRSGLDAAVVENEAGRLIGGINAAVGRSNLDVNSLVGNGDIDTAGYTLAGTLTWYGFDGLYVDGQAQYSRFYSDLKSDVLGRLADNVGGSGRAFSLEVGKRFAYSEEVTLIPQAQLIYSSVDFDAFTDPFGAMVSMVDGDSLEGRMGLAAEHASSWYEDDGTLSRVAVYGIANVNYEFLDGSSVNVSGTLFDSQPDAWTGDIGVGGSYNWGDDIYSLYGEMSYGTSLSNIGDSYTLTGDVGFRMKW